MLAATRSDDVRIQNRRRVLAAVRRGDVVSRTDIGKITGLSAATVSAITSDFLDEGVLIPPQMENASPPGRGRPKVALELNPEAAMICAVYVQLNGISAAMVDYAGCTISEASLDITTLGISMDEIRTSLTSCVNEALAQSGQHASHLCRIAVGFQGVTDVEGSSVLWTPICGLHMIPVRQWLETAFGVPTKVANDCDLIARALNWRDPDKYGQNFGAILLAHGVGMGLYLRDGIINGTRSSGVEFGHMTYIPNGALCRCGNRGCIEAYAGDYAIIRRARGEAEDAPPPDLLASTDLGKIKVAANNGDADALAAIESAGSAIGTGLASLYALVDPFPVVLVGRGSIFFDQLEAALRQGLSAAPGGDAQKNIEIDCYEDETPLVHEGCAISALLIQDEEMSERRVPAEAAQ